MKSSQIFELQNDNIFQQQMLGCENIDQVQSCPFADEPKEEYAQIMVKITQELQGIMQQTYENIEKAELVQQISKLKREQEKKIQSLKLSQHLLESTHSFNIQQMKTKYDELKQERDCTVYENQKLRQEIRTIRLKSVELETNLRKCENKIANQECLIDEYKKSIEEQINLQKEVIKVEYMQRELENKAQFEKALKCMEENYERRISELKYESVYRDYKNDVKRVKKFCNTLTKQSNKTNLVGQFETSKNKQTFCQVRSSYSTIQK